MASQTTPQPSCINENLEAEECQDNNVSEITVEAGSLKSQVGKNERSFTQQSKENKPLPGTFTPPKNTSGEVKAKSRLSGLQSALTPMLKILNIGNKSKSPKTVKPENSPDPKRGGSGQKPNADLSRGTFGRPLGDKDASVCWLDNEHLPEITLFDLTCDSTMQLTRNDSALPDSMPATPVTTRSAHVALPPHHHMHLSLSNNLNTTGPKPTFQNKIIDPLQSNNNVLNVEAGSKDPGSSVSINATTVSPNPDSKVVETPARTNAPLRWLDDRFFPEITLLDVTHDSELSPAGDVSSVEVSQGIPPYDLKVDTPSMELSGENVPKPSGSDRTQTEELLSSPSADVTHTISSPGLQSEKCAEETEMIGSLTQDISMGSVSENSGTSLDPSEQNMVKTQMSAEDTLGTHPANITHDISASSNTSVKSTASQLSTSNMQVNVSSENVSSELHGEPVQDSNIKEAKNEQIPASNDTEKTNKTTQPIPEEKEGSANATFSITQTSTNISMNVNTTTEIAPHLSNTLDFSPSAKSDNMNNDSKEKGSASNITTETSQSSSSDKTGSLCDVQYATFDQHSEQKSRDSTSVLEGALQNNTFDSKPLSKQNGTITLSESSSNDSHQNNLDKSSAPTVCNATSSPKDSNAEVPPSEPVKPNETITKTEPEVQVVDNAQVTFEASPAVEMSSEAGHHDSKDQSHPGLSLTVGLSDTLGPQNMETGNNKANTFDLDDTLDFVPALLTSSTPMPNSKMLGLTDRDDGKILGAQKKLYGDGSAKPVQAQSDVRSNIICDRKTFFTQTAAKSLLPPLKSACPLLRHKPTSTPLGRTEPSASGLPMTRQRTQALRSTAAPEPAQVTTGTTSSYNLRATTTGSKLPVSGLPRPHMTGIPTAIQRAALSLRPPLARSGAPISTADKLRCPTAPNPVVKTSQTKKHPLVKGESLQTAKRKKMEAPLSCSGAEASEYSCDTANGTKTLKHPVTSQRGLPAKRKKDDASLPTSNDETEAPCDAAKKIRTRTQPATTHRALIPKMQSHGCTKCVELEEQLKIQSDEIIKLRAELQKYIKQEDKF